MQIPPQLFFFLILFVFAGFIVLAFVLEKKRKDEFVAICGQIGLRYLGESAPDLYSRVNNLELFNKGHSRHFFNIMAGQWQKYDVNVFDYRYTTGSGKRSHTYNQTVIRFNIAELQFPPFVMVPENFFFTIAEFFGYKDIDFTNYPVFSKKYFLRSSQEATIRDLFVSHVVKFFEETPDKFIIEAKGNDMIIYKSSFRFEPKDLRIHLDQAAKIVNLFGNRTI